MHGYPYKTAKSPNMFLTHLQMVHLPLKWQVAPRDSRRMIQFVLHQTTGRSSMGDSIISQPHYSLNQLQLKKESFVNKTARELLHFLALFLFLFSFFLPSAFLLSLYISNMLKLYCYHRYIKAFRFFNKLVVYKRLVAGLIF